MRCKSCKSAIPKKALFCPKCGASASAEDTIPAKSTMSTADKITAAFLVGCTVLMFVSWLSLVPDDEALGILSTDEIEEMLSMQMGGYSLLTFLPTWMQSDIDSYYFGGSAPSYFWILLVACLAWYVQLLSFAMELRKVVRRKRSERFGVFWAFFTCLILVGLTVLFCFLSEGNGTGFMSLFHFVPTVWCYVTAIVSVAGMAYAWTIRERG